MAKKNNLRITEILKSKGLTLGDLAERIAAQSPDGKLLTKSTLCGRINGNPTLSNLYELANALDVKITELFPAEDQVQATQEQTPSVYDKDIAAYKMEKMLNGETNLPDPLEQRDSPTDPMGLFAGFTASGDHTSPLPNDDHSIKLPPAQDIMPVTTFCPHCGKRVRVGVVLLPEEE